MQAKENLEEGFVESRFWEGQGRMVKESEDER